ncbi:SLBB domain-containing protein [Draconibacterium sp. IB214405]|uniref:SLBB domain-containing protein n=1 Tax=Draconibacterium sp. IB214405 TaxID=3097352 RepID=UPI002A0F757F|nr:SLBB domain-containing protein [Draconibacterium sp. IB214405]MDX8339311.1 SLBB domain-containing protein [Draconibacterium sp. IB214405]
MKIIPNRILAVFACIFLFFASSAQDVKNVDVKTVPQQDIKKAQQAMQDAGLSVDDAADLARQRGATEQQINDFRNRITEEGTGDAVISDPVEEASELVEEQQDVERSTRSAGFETRGRIFGAYLFNSKNLTFEPRLNIQTPKTYEIGIGDQLLIHIWGNSQNDYQLNVNSNGQINIPDVGPVYIAGLTFNAAEEKIKSRLTEIYSDMGGNNPGTFAQVNMGQLRSIQVNLVGEVVTPGTYTLPVTATVFNGLYLSGGPNNIGSFRNIKVIRDNKIEKVIDIYQFLVSADPTDNIVLKDGDILFIPPADKRVEVKGEFKRNGIFELKEGDMLNDLIRFTGGFTENAYLARTQVLRKTQQGQQIIDVRYDQMATTPLLNGDVVSNAKILESFANRITIAGAVYRPGEYEWTEGLTLSQLILKADSLTADAFQSRGMITRYNPDLSTSTIAFSVAEIAEGSKDIVLQPEDMVLIKSHFELKEQQYISVDGEVLQPGQFNWSDRLTLGDAIFLAGGFTEGADSTFIEIARRLSYTEAAALSDTVGHIIVANLSRKLTIGENDADLQLQPYDHISVRRAPNYRQGETAFISGEITYAGPYSISNKQLRISDLVTMAGGITPQAYLAGATLERYSEELGAERVAIDLATILENPRSEKDLFLNNGDRLSIPEFMQTVKITGNVQNPFSITYQSGKNAKYYIDRSGGFDSNAKRKKTYVRYPNGETAVTKGVVFKRYPEVTPGSVVVVPEKPEKQPGESGRWLAIASAIASLTVSIATIVNLTN